VDLKENLYGCVVCTCVKRRYAYVFLWTDAERVYYFVDFQKEIM